MHMDVRGRDPEAPRGERYAVPDATWRALLRVVHDAGYNVPTEWTDRTGAGLADPDECRRLADRLEGFLATHADNLFVWASDPVRVDQLRKGEDYEGEGPPPYRVTRDEVHAFIDFLRRSGGFAIH
ncbi:hypothetical protein HUS23_11935 [Ectothiorhodospiraceae bacterium 2226]|nr:hypothetical protein HUS23_11935 [Ectothiorhodospiraceae bacterium 2226]